MSRVCIYQVLIHIQLVIMYYRLRYLYHPPPPTFHLTSSTFMVSLTSDRDSQSVATTGLVRAKIFDFWHLRGRLSSPDAVLARLGKRGFHS